MSRQQLESAPEREEAAPASPAPRAAATAPPALSPAALLRLQRTAGNQAVAAMIARQAPSGVPEGLAPAPAPPAGEVITKFLADLWANDPASAVRLGLEVIRVFPAIGLPAGALADVIAAGQDLTSIPTGNLALTGVVGLTVGLRSLTNLAGNGIGQLLAISQLITAFTAGYMGVELTSVVASPAALAKLPFLAFMVLLNEDLTGLKLSLTLATGGLDFFISLEAAAGVVLGPVADSAAWVDLMEGFIANQIGTILAFANEVIGAGSLGATQSGMIGMAMKAIEGTLDVIVRNTGPFRDLIIGFWNVLGGRAIDALPDLDELFPPPEGLKPRPPEGAAGPGARPQPTPLARTPAAGDGGAAAADRAWLSAWVADFGAMRDAVGQGDALLGPAAEQAAELIAFAGQTAQDAEAGKEGFAQVRETLAAAMGEFEGRLALVRDVDAQAGEGLEQLTAVDESLATAIAGIEALTLPPLEAPAEADLGEGAVLDTVEAGIDAGASLGAGAMQAAYDEIAEALEAAKQATLEPLIELRAGLEPLRAAIEEAIEVAQMLAPALERGIAELGEAIARADSVPELLQAMIDQLAAAAGAGAGATLGDVRAAWLELGPMIDEARAAAEARLAG